MTEVGQPFREGRSKQDLLKWKDKSRFQNIFSNQAVFSYLYLSIGMGIVALLLPVLLVVFGGYTGNYSISYFYWVGDWTRNILVGSLWAIGVFLFLFQGLSSKENWILNVAGGAAIGVAMFPMPAQQCGTGRPFTFHATCALIFFACLAIVAIGFSKGRIKYIIHDPKRLRFKRAYELAGALMIAAPAAVIAVHYAKGGDCENHWIFWIEVFGVYAFAFYWFVKTAEYRILLGVKLKPFD